MSRMHDPAHPGEVLKEWFPEDMTVTAAAQQLGVSRVMLSKILNGKAGISADMALRLAAWLARKFHWFSKPAKFAADKGQRPPWRGRLLKN